MVRRLKFDGDNRSPFATRVMIPDLDIYRSANLLVKQHGPDAPIHAATLADDMLEKGDLDGFAVWKRVLRAIDEMGNTTLGADQAMN